jgi:hypothetical protein
MIKNQREGFSMFMAIIVIVMMASVAALVANVTGKIVQSTTTQYQKEQAVLLAKSYTELAIMAVSANDRNASGVDCIEDINGVIGPSGASENGEGYQVQTRIAYIGNNQFGSCAATRVLSSSVVTPQSSLNIIVDVYVRYKALDHPGTSPWITYHRRTLQKI